MPASILLSHLRKPSTHTHGLFAHGARRPFRSRLGAQGQIVTADEDPGSLGHRVLLILTTRPRAHAARPATSHVQVGHRAALAWSLLHRGAALAPVPSAPV